MRQQRRALNCEQVPLPYEHAWNARTLRGVRKRHELTREKNQYKWDIIGLAETRWKNASAIQIKNS